MDIQFWQTTAMGVYGLIVQMMIIILPVMLFMELLKDLNILDRITEKLHWTVKPFALPQAAVFPLIVGLIFGLSYGAGFIVQAAKDGTLSKRDLYLVSLFLVINHSALEDTLLFVSIGANGWLLLIFRFAASIIITWAVSKFLMPPTPLNLSQAQQS